MDMTCVIRALFILSFPGLHDMYVHHDKWFFFPLKTCFDDLNVSFLNEDETTWNYF